MLLANKMPDANEFHFIKDNNESIEKFVKLKTKKLSKDKKLSKSQKLAKIAKSSKYENSPNLNTKINGLSFLNVKTRTTFHCLQ